MILTAVEERNRSAQAGELVGGRDADAPGTAGDDDSLAGQIHCGCPFVTIVSRPAECRALDPIFAASSNRRPCLSVPPEWFHDVPDHGQLATAGIDPGVGQIDDQVQVMVISATTKTARRHQWQVAAFDGLNEQLPDPGPGKDDLDHDRTVEECGRLSPTTVRVGIMALRRA